MSKLETPLTRAYWEKVGGTLVEEFYAVQPSSTCGKRVIDGVIIRGGKKYIARASEVNLEGKDIIVVQTKLRRRFALRLAKAVPDSVHCLTDSIRNAPVTLCRPRLWSTKPTCA